MLRIISTLLAIVSCLLAVAYSDNNKTNSDIIRQLLTNYDKDELPRTGHSTEVRVGMYIMSISALDEHNMDFSVEMYFRRSWNDPRLAFSSINNKIRNLRFPEHVLNQIWIPDVFFRNAKSAKLTEQFSTNQLLMVSPKGDVWYVSKLSVQFSCPMMFPRYPFDTQTCSITTESFGYTSDILDLKFLERPVEVDHNIRLPGFTLVTTKEIDCSQNYTAGAFPCLSFDFVFSRDLTTVLLQVYLPSILLVSLTWIAFWFDHESTLARMLTGLLSLIALLFLGTNSRQVLSRVSYFTSLDAWLIVCHVFVFTSIVEYVLVNILSKQTNKFRELLKPPYQKLQKDTETEADKATLDSGYPTSNGKRKALLVDWFSRILFPVVFLLFNLIYWITNLSAPIEI